MKFSQKVFCSTLLIIALIFSLGSAVLLHSVLRTSLEHEEQISLDENQMLCFSFSAAASSAMETNTLHGLDGTLSDSAVRRIAWKLESGNDSAIRISDGEKHTLYVSDDFVRGRDLRAQAQSGQRLWAQFEAQEERYIHTISGIAVNEQIFYVESMRNITGVLRQWEDYVRLYQLIALWLMSVSALIMLLFSMYLTRPIKRLSAASRRIAQGEYQLRCAVTSRDEIGALTEDFNAMADSLEGKIHELEEAARRQEEFIASFAHELKTPLTSIIGYSDMLRSQELEPEQRFKAASYVYSEGKRLEGLSHKLLDLIVYRRCKLQPGRIRMKPWLEEVGALLQPSFDESGVQLSVQVEAANVCADADLLKTMLLNLCDNARKASAPGQVVELCGSACAAGYRISVRDHGCGMEQAELQRITEPFYMVDKSRARSQNGAGLGLALCAAVAQMHETHLEFETAPGQGTCVWVQLQLSGEGEV